MMSYSVRFVYKFHILCKWDLTQITWFKLGPAYFVKSSFLNCTQMCKFMAKKFEFRAKEGEGKGARGRTSIGSVLFTHFLLQKFTQLSTR